MTEKKLNESLSNIFRKFENIQVSKVDVKRVKEQRYDVLNIHVENVNIQIGYMSYSNYKRLYVTVNNITTCDICNINMSFQTFYDNVEVTLYTMLDDIETL